MATVFFSWLGASTSHPVQRRCLVVLVGLVVFRFQGNQLRIQGGFPRDTGGCLSSPWLSLIWRPWREVGVPHRDPLPKFSPRKFVGPKLVLMRDLPLCSCLSFRDPVAKFQHLLVFMSGGGFNLAVTNPKF